MFSNNFNQQQKLFLVETNKENLKKKNVIKIKSVSKFFCRRYEQQEFRNKKKIQKDRHFLNNILFVSNFMIKNFPL